MQHQQTTENFVQLNNKRFSIQQFLDILEYQKQLLSETNKAASEPEAQEQDEHDDDSFGLVEVDLHKEQCLQSVLNKFDFEAVVKAYNLYWQDGEEANIDEMMDVAYELLSCTYDEWQEEDYRDQVEVIERELGLFTCKIYPCGIVELSSSLVAIGDIKAKTVSEVNQINEE